MLSDESAEMAAAVSGADASPLEALIARSFLPEGTKMTTMTRMGMDIQ